MVCMAFCWLVAGDSASDQRLQQSAGRDESVGYRDLEAIINRLVAANAEQAAANAELAAEVRAAISGVHARLDSAETTMATATRQLSGLQDRFDHPSMSGPGARTVKIT